MAVLSLCRYAAKPTDSRTLAISSMKDWRALLQRQTPISRQIVTKLLSENRLVFTPQEDRSWEFTGRASFGKLLQGIVLPQVWRPQLHPRAAYWRSTFVMIRSGIDRQTRGPDDSYLLPCHWIAPAVLCPTICWSATSLGQSQEVLRNADIVTMTTARLAADTIVLKIETSTNQFDTSTDALTVLKAAGVPDVVITSMIKAGARTTNSPTSPNTPPPSPAPTPVTRQDDSKATVYVYRPGKFFGKALEPSVFLGEQKLLDMDNARYFALKLDPGRHVLRSNEKDSEIDQSWEAGKTYYVKITIASGKMKGHGQMGMVTENLARREMQKLRPLDRDHVQADYLRIVHLIPIK